MDVRYARWVGGPVVARETRGTGAMGRNPEVRPVLEPVEARRSAGFMGRRSRSRPGAEAGGEAILAVAGAEVPVVVLGEVAVDEFLDDMLWEARRVVRGEKARGGAIRTVKGGG